jgi:hypothetical protein
MKKPHCFKQSIHLSLLQSRADTQKKYTSQHPKTWCKSRTACICKRILPDIFTRHTLERPRYIPPAAQFQRQRGTDLRQPPASLMSQYQKTPTVSQFDDKILAKRGHLEVEIKDAKKLMPKLKVLKNQCFTSNDPHHDIYTCSYWQIFWHSI